MLVTPPAASIWKYTASKWFRPSSAFAMPQGRTIASAFLTKVAAGAFGSLLWGIAAPCSALMPAAVSALSAVTWCLLWDFSPLPETASNTRSLTCTTAPSLRVKSYVLRRRLRASNGFMLNMAMVSMMQTFKDAKHAQLRNEARTSFLPSLVPSGE